MMEIVMNICTSWVGVHDISPEDEQYGNNLFLMDILAIQPYQEGIGLIGIICESIGVSAFKGLMTEYSIHFKRRYSHRAVLNGAPSQTIIYNGDISPKGFEGGYHSVPIDTADGMLATLKGNFILEPWDKTDLWDYFYWYQ